jgi:uncharacterized membrane protein YraQ (UPF0718 family)
VLPAAASFKRQGANRGALSAFLVTTPESGVDSIAITYALLDPIMTVMRPLAAFVTGVTAGLVENRLHDPDAAGRQPSPLPLASAPSPAAGKILPAATESPPESRALRRLGEGLRYALVDVWGDIVVWFCAGLLLAGLITAYLPEDFSNLVLGGGLVSMLAMLAVGMPIYICATASTPIAAALLLKGASPGAVLVFLLAGPATNMTSLSVLVQVLGKMGTLRYLLVVAIVSVLFGLGLDKLYPLLGIEPRAVIGEARELVPVWLKIGSATFLMVLTAWHLYRFVRHRRSERPAGTAVCGFPQPAEGADRSRATHHRSSGEPCRDDCCRQA